MPFLEIAIIPIFAIRSTSSSAHRPGTENDSRKSAPTENEIRAKIRQKKTPKIVPNSRKPASNSLLAFSA